MCSRDDGETEAEVRKKNSCLNRKCMKCDETAFVITRMNDAFCRDCFMVYVVHKFRSSIGKSKLVRDGDEVLLSYSGGPSSTALLHLVKEGLSERAHKKLRFKPAILYIDESSVLGLPPDDIKRYRHDIIDIMNNTGFTSYISYIEEGLSSPNTKENESSDGRRQVHVYKTDENIDKPCVQKIESIQSLMKSFKTLTAKETFLKNLRIQLLLAVSKQLGYSKVMTGESNSRLAVNILNDITQGRGAQVSHATAFCDTRYEDIMILRPIRDLSSKEIAVYNKMNKLRSIFIPTLSTKGSSGCSIERLTETFVTGLQADYLSTVSNIVRTGEKLGVGEDINGVQTCGLCQTSLDTQVGPASALVAVEFSEKLSKQGKQASVDSVTNGSNTDNHRKQLYKQLCYGCRVTASEMTNEDELLPAFSKLNTRELMRQEFEEFLLNPDDNT